jgi:hypothetical protein
MPLRQLIDKEIRAAWEREKVTPAAPASDAAFLRRVYLDLVGTIPTYEETVAFLKDTDSDKRARLVDKLLADPRFGRQQATLWDLLLFGRGGLVPEIPRQRDVFVKWLAERFNQNAPYDRWVRELLLAEGNTLEHGPPMYYAQFRNRPEEAAVAVSRVFLGTQLQCARCHDHPFDKWKQQDFYGLAGFFVRLTLIGGGVNNTNGKAKMMIGEKSTGEVLFTGAPAGDQRAGKKGTPVPARYLGGDVLQEPPLPKDFKEPDFKGVKDNPPKPLFSRKEKLAEWVTQADNPYFARAIANRIWGQFMGRGLVHPVDDLSDTNKPTHPELLDAMAKELVAQKFDLKWLMREIVNSQAYQLAASGPGTDAAPRWYERARVRPLSAEEIMAALRVATGAEEGRTQGGAREYFLRAFGEPTTGRGDFQASLDEHLFLNNSGEIRQMIQRRKGNLADIVLTLPAEQRVERLFLTVLNRPPTEKEKQRFEQHLRADAGKSEALVEEAIWVLLACGEFRFNH